MSQDVAIYCVCFPEHEPWRHQKYQKNIMCNAGTISDSYRGALAGKGFVFDDDGDNISNLNWTFGDLTATYWIWKNSTNDVVGTSQYRRFWDKSIESLAFQKNTLYVQDPIQFDQRTLKEQYIGSHGELGISMLDELSKANKIPLTPEMLERAYALNYLHGCNMFVAHKETYDKFCELLFGIIFQLHETYGDTISELDGYNRRTPAFLGERVVAALIENREHFFPELNVVPLKWRVKKKSVLRRLKSKFPKKRG